MSNASDRRAVGVIVGVSAIVLALTFFYSPSPSAAKGGGCHPTCQCLGLECPAVAGDCSGCGGSLSDDNSPGKGGGNCAPGTVCSDPGSGDGGGDDGGGSPPGSCYSILLALECIEDPDEEHDGCVCGHSATLTEEVTYFACVEALNLIPVPPNGSCELICGYLPSELGDACMAVCNELCEDNPGCVDISDWLIDLICCDLATGTSVPWAECSDPATHPFPDNPSSQCCIDNNQNSWVYGCKQCCATEATYGSAVWQQCVQKCDITPIQQGWCPY